MLRAIALIACFTLPNLPAFSQDKKPAVKEIDADTIAVYEKLGAEYGWWVKPAWPTPGDGRSRQFPLWFRPSSDRQDDGSSSEIVLPGFRFKKFSTAKLPRVAVPFGLMLDDASDADVAEMDELDNMLMLDLGFSRITDAGLKRLLRFDKLATLRLSLRYASPSGIMALGGLKGLTCLEARGIQSAEGRQALAALVDLRELYLPSTNMQADSIKRLAALKKLNMLQFDNVSLRQSVEILGEIGLLHAMPNATAKGGARPRSAEEVVSLRIGGYLTPAQMQKFAAFKNIESLQIHTLDFWGGGSQDFSYKGPNALFKDVARFEKLVELDVVSGNSKMTGAGLGELAGLKHLAVLRLGGQLNQAGIKEILTLKNLTKLHLAAPGITDSDLKKLAPLAKLVALDLAGTEITNAGMKDVARFKELTMLNIRGTRVRDFGVKELAVLSNLTALDLSQTEVTDAALRELVGMKKLATLNLVGTRTTDAGIAELQKALPKCKIER